jgi:hypothetical protein
MVGGGRAFVDTTQLAYAPPLFILPSLEPGDHTIDVPKRTSTVSCW